MTSAFTFSSLLQFLFNDKEYQRKIIDNLVVKVLVGDGDTVVYINLSNTKEIENVRLEEMKTALEHIFGVQTLSPLAQRRGFEPPDDSPPSHDFQSCSLNHSDISASLYIIICTPEKSKRFSGSTCKSKEISRKILQIRIADAAAI